jgi:hypothetical protein
MLIKNISTEQHLAQLKLTKKVKISAKAIKCSSKLPTKIGQSDAASPLDEFRLWFGY